MNSTASFCIFLKNPKELDQDEIIEILDQAKAGDPERHKVKQSLIPT
jgi:hypothetical protein